MVPTMMVAASAASSGNCYYRAARLSTTLVNCQRPGAYNNHWNGIASVISSIGSHRFFSSSSSSSDGDSQKGRRPPPSSSLSRNKSKKKGPLAEMLSNIDLKSGGGSSQHSKRRQDHGKFRLRDGDETSSSTATDTTHFLESAFPSIVSKRDSSTSGFRGKAISAISLLHSDYEDYDEDDTFEGGAKGAADSVDDSKKEEVDGDDRRKGRKEQARKLLEWEEQKEEQQRRWIENSKPIEREQELDERGRSYGRGGRKTATARVFLFPGEGHITVNRKDMADYFQRQSLRAMIVNPFVATKTCGMFDVLCSVEGGGLSGKAGAIRHGIARALEKYNPDFRPPLKVLGYLTRDPRMVERKKPGLKKARKAKQWVKR
jgi:small subunit ribosomal protein S9